MGMQNQKSVAAKTALFILAMVFSVALTAPVRASASGMAEQPSLSGGRPAQAFAG